MIGYRNTNIYCIRVSVSNGPHDSNGPPIWRPLRPRNRASPIVTNLLGLGPWVFTYRENEKYKRLQSKKNEENRSCVPTNTLDKNPQWGPLLSFWKYGRGPLLSHHEDRYCQICNKEDRYCRLRTVNMIYFRSLNSLKTSYLHALTSGIWSLMLRTG